MCLKASWNFISNPLPHPVWIFYHQETQFNRIVTQYMMVHKKEHLSDKANCRRKVFVGQGKNSIFNVFKFSQWPRWKGSDVGNWGEKERGWIRIQQSDVAYHNNTHIHTLTAGFAITCGLWWSIAIYIYICIYDLATFCQEGGIQFELLKPELNYIKRVISPSTAGGVAHCELGLRRRNDGNIKMLHRRCGIFLRPGGRWNAGNLISFTVTVRLIDFVFFFYLHSWCLRLSTGGRVYYLIFSHWIYWETIRGKPDLFIKFVFVNNFYMRETDGWNNMAFYKLFQCGFFMKKKVFTLIPRGIFFAGISIHPRCLNS